MYQNDACKCLLQNVRLSYCALLEPRAPKNGGDPKYSVTLLVPKSDNAALADLQSAVQAAMLSGKDGTWKGVVPPNPHIPIHDGDGPRESGEPYGDECKGMWVLTASSKMQPEVVDQSGKPIINPSDIYSGMFAHVTIRFYAYSNSGNKGVGCGLGNVMKTKDGEPLGGRTNASTDFAGLVQATPVAPAGGMPWSAQPAAPAAGYPAQAASYQQPAAPQQYGAQPGYYGQPGTYPQQ